MKKYPTETASCAECIYLKPLKCSFDTYQCKLTKDLFYSGSIFNDRGMSYGIFPKTCPLEVIQ